MLTRHRILNLSYDIRLSTFSKLSSTSLSRIPENIGVYQERNETNQSEIFALQITEKSRAAAIL